MTKLFSTLDAISERILETIATRLYAFNGTTWDRVKSTGGKLDVNAVVTGGGDASAANQVEGHTRIGALIETAPDTDTASSGLNGRLQRIAQRITSLIALLPAALGAGGGLKVEGVAGGVAQPVSGTVTADTELPAAAPLSNTFANPTTPVVGAALMGWYGTAWERIKTGLLEQAGMPRVAIGIGTIGLDDAANEVIGLPSTDFQSLPLLTCPSLSNGVTWDRERNNHEVTALPSAARTIATNSADLVNYNARGVIVTIDVTAVAGTPSLTFSIKYKDTLSGKYVALLVSAAITAIGTTSLTVYPGIAAAANSKADSPLPRKWRVEVAVGTADSVTYSVSANYIN